MSALAAVLTPAGADSAAVERMLATSPHRGTGIELATHGAWSLGVANPTEPNSWREASVATTSQLAVSWVGALDNYADLSAELARRGETPPGGDGPAELVLAGWKVFGEGLPARLRGMFAAVVTDGQRAWCFRDHVGLRPLFYRAQRGAAFIGSEARQVAAGAGMPREADLDVVERVLFKDVDNDAPAAIKGVARLPKATLLRVERDRAERRAYWNPQDDLETARLTDDEVAERFHELMTQAAARTLTGEGDVLSLSGGIDSPAVAAYANPAHVDRYGRPLPALATVYPNQPTVDESQYIKIVADRFHMPLHTYERDAQPLKAGVEWLRVLDGPIPYLLLSDAEDHYRRARELGFRNMLTGEIAELVVDMRGNLVGHLILNGRVRAARSQLSRRRSRGRSLRSLGRELVGEMAPRWLYSGYRRRRDTRWVSRYPAWIDRQRVRDGFARDVTTPRRRWGQEQTATWMGPGLTMEAEEVCQSVMHMRTRRPWADVDLWRFFLSLPAHQKFPDIARKGLVRRLLRGKVPNEILDRRGKVVFDESLMARIEYQELRTWLLAPEHCFRGVDYKGLAGALERQDLDLSGYLWAKDLAIAHAFLSFCDR